MCDKPGTATFTCSSGIAQCLSQRETGWSQGLTQLAQSHRFYSFIVPNTSAKLVAAGATSLHFSPCGRHILGVTGNGHNVSLWDIDKFLRRSSDDSSCRRRNEPAALRSDRGAEERHLGRGPAPGRPQGPGTYSNPYSNDRPVPLAAAFPIAPAIDFSATLRNTLASANASGSALGKRSRSTMDRSSSGNTYRFLSPVDVSSESILEDARGLLSPRSKHSDALLYEMWKQRSQEQQAIIASWEEEQGRRRRRQARITAAAAAEENSFLPEPAKPSQPMVTRIPRVRECLNIVPPIAPTRTGQAASSPAPAATTPPSDPVPALSLARPRFSSSVTSGGETLIDDVCLFTHDLKYVLLISETQPEQAPGSPLPVCASTSILMVSLLDGTVVDRLQLQNERLVLRTNRAGATWSLLQDTLVLLLPHKQQIHILHCSSEGSLVHRRTVGRYLQHDDELVLSTFDSREDLFQARCAAEPRLEAHGRLLPAQITALVSMHNAPRAPGISRQAAAAPDPGARGESAVGAGSPTPAAMPATAASVGPASTSTGLSTGASSEDGVEPVTGLWQRMAAFLYKRALAGEELGLSDLFHSSYPQERSTGDLRELVDIVQRSTSLADAMERMTDVPGHTRQEQAAAASGASPDASASKALRQFHRYRADLDHLFVAAVHLLQVGRLLILLTCRKNRLMPMVVLYDWESDRVLFASALYTVKVVVCMMWYSEQLNHLHKECMWRSYMPHLHVMAQQLETLASHPVSAAQAGGAGGGGVATQTPGAVASHASSSVSRSSTPPPALRPVVSSLKPSPVRPLVGRALGAATSSSCAIQQRMHNIVAAARKVGPERMRQFMMWHLPGASQAMLSSPYTDPLMYRVIRHERMVHLHASRWLRFLAAQPKIEFYNVARSGDTPAFELDCSMASVEDTCLLSTDHRIEVLATDFSREATQLSTRLSAAVSSAAFQATLHVQPAQGHMSGKHVDGVTLALGSDSSTGTQH